MGWKCSMIIVDAPMIGAVVSNADTQPFLEELGYSNLEEIETTSTAKAIFPDMGTVYIGQFRDKLILTDQAFAEIPERHKPSAIEKKMAKLFPNTEILTLSLHSVTNFWGYALSKDEYRLRTRMGAADEGTVMEKGEPLEEEKVLLKDSFLKNGNRFYPNPEDPQDPYWEDQMGEEFVFELWKRRFGKRLDFEDDLDDTKMLGFRYTQSKIPKIKIESFDPNVKPKNNYWVKWVLGAIFILLVKLIRQYYFDA
ncbi:MAG: hypothetical protein N4A46_15335 [Schleiferiaceae bacterium]|nr:hypothetical protein [Schleiferiaceae bacterium]